MIRRVCIATIFAAALVVFATSHRAWAVGLLTTNPNNDAASLAAAGGPAVNQAGFANVGRSSTGNASVVYLGNGWVITAGHNTIGNSPAVSPGGVSFGGVQYTIDTSTITFLHNADNSLADLQMFKIEGNPTLPSIAAPTIDTSLATGRQIMIGNGLNIDLSTQLYWNVNTSNPNNFVWTSEPNPGTPGPNDASGFNIGASRTIRWGDNNVVTDGMGHTQTEFIHTADLGMQPLTTHGYMTQLDNTAYTGQTPLANEAYATTGDSGGAVYTLVGGTWELSGIMLAELTLNNQPGNTAVFGDQTFIADLSQYSSQIEALIVPEPASGSLALVGLASLAWRARRRRR